MESKTPLTISKISLAISLLSPAFLIIGIIISPLNWIMTFATFSYVIAAAPFVAGLVGILNIIALKMNDKYQISKVDTYCYRAFMIAFFTSLPEISIIYISRNLLFPFVIIVACFICIFVISAILYLRDKKQNKKSALSTILLSIALLIMSLSMAYVIVAQYHSTHLELSTEYQFSENTLGITYLQEMTPQICNDMPKRSTIQLVDARDNNEYAIAKLADNNCWMVQNLRLGNTDTTIELTSNNSNIKSSSFILPKAVDKDTQQYPEIFYLNSAEYNAGTTAEREFVKYQHSDLGNLYNYEIASAGTNDSTQSICPKGWQIPTGGPNGDYTHLFNHYDNPLDAPLYFVLSGEYREKQNGQGYYGYYWSSTEYSNSEMYILGFNDGDYISREDHTNRINAIAIRCIAIQ